MQERNKQKQAYEQPKLEELGSFESLTRGNQDGNLLDADFPVNTPKPLLTFS